MACRVKAGNDTCANRASHHRNQYHGARRGQHQHRHRPQQEQVELFLHVTPEQALDHAEPENQDVDQEADPERDVVQREQPRDPGSRRRRGTDRANSP